MAATSAITIAAAEIVTGDVLELEAGDLVAADARLLSAASFKCVESALTGESEADAQSESILDREELEDYVRYLEDHRSSSEKEVLDEAERRFADVSDQYQAMAEAGTLLGDREENAGLREALDRAEANLLETSGPAVRAGLSSSARSARASSSTRRGWW